jgi:hypothetical protein
MSSGITAEEARAIAQEAARLAVKDGVPEALRSLGVDVDNPLKTQADFAHLREWRESSEEFKKHGMKVLIGIIVTSGAGLLWVGFKHKLGF